MNSSLIGKIEKARRYAQEPERVSFSQFECRFQGEHDGYHVAYTDGQWSCSCSFFAGWNVCSHTMALYRLIQPMLPKEAAPRGVMAATA